MIYAERQADGRLRNIRNYDQPELDAGAQAGLDLVPLDSMPTGLGPFVLSGRAAIPAPLDEGERLDRLEIPGRVLAALVVGALPAADTTAGEKTWARGVLLEVRDRVRAARSGP